jgi:anti-sigma factor RsiW
MPRPGGGNRGGIPGSAPPPRRAGEASGKDNSQAEGLPLNCAGCAENLQEYVDGDLSRDVALRVFLHVRECSACQAELTRWQHLVQALGQLPSLEPPADFDRRILAAVPYASYREMAPLRSARVPVYLQESFLPAFVRAKAVRLGGVVIALGCAAAVVAGDWPSGALLAAAGGLLPEALVRLQDLGRSLALGLRRSEGGS